MSPRPRDQRADEQAFQRELIAGGIVILVLVGGGLIALLWGVGPMLAALPCFGGALGLGLVLWLVLKVIEWAGRERE